nr:GNAT family N-acetyltransferase [Flexivirga oryzae]
MTKPSLVPAAAHPPVTAPPPGDDPRPGAVRLTVTGAPTDGWWVSASPRALEHRETLVQVLARVPEAAYLTAYLNDRPAGHARLAFHDGWSGIFDVHTDPVARRSGIATALMTEAARVAGERRIPLQYLQVAADNAAAVGLYGSLGWVVHHAYHYATPEV